MSSVSVFPFFNLNVSCLIKNTLKFRRNLDEKKEKFREERKSKFSRKTRDCLVEIIRQGIQDDKLGKIVVHRYSAIKEFVAVVVE